MKIKSLLLLSFYGSVYCLSFFSCQTAKKAEDAEENQAERLAQQLQQQKEDSLQTAFCQCLVEDNISREKRLKNIDSFISQDVDISIPCYFEEEKVSNLAETALVNMGVAVSNRILRTKFKKRNSKVNTVTKSYPILMIFNEDTTMIRQLVSRGADLNLKTNDIVSVPEYYVTQNEVERLKFALSLGADIEKININTTDEKMIDYLINSGAKKESINKVALLKKDNYKELVQKYGINVSKTTCSEFSKISKVTQFRKIDFERTAWLLKNKVDAACIDGSFLEDIINENFDNRISNLTTKKKSNQHTREEWLELMNEYNVSWNQCTSFGKSPLMLAVEKHDISLLRIILNQNATVNFNCNFAGHQKTVKDVLEKEMQYAENNERERRENKKYSKKDEEKYIIYVQKLNEMKSLLEGKE